MNFHNRSFISALLRMAVERFNASIDRETLLCPRTNDIMESAADWPAASERAIAHRLAFYLEHLLIHEHTKGARLRLNNGELSGQRPQWCGAFFHAASTSFKIRCTTPCAGSDSGFSFCNSANLSLNSGRISGRTFFIAKSVCTSSKRAGTFCGQLRHCWMLPSMISRAPLIKLGWTPSMLAQRTDKSCSSRNR